MNTARRFVLWSFTVLVITALPGAAIAGANVPFKGTDAGTFAIPGLCPDGRLNVVISGAGHVSHLGRYAYAADECFDPNTGSFTGVATFTAANGDQLWGTYAGQVGPTSDPNVITYMETLVFSGGSGRLVGASGEVQVEGLADLATGDYHQILHGQLSNPGLTRSS